MTNSRKVSKIAGIQAAGPAPAAPGAQAQAASAITYTNRKGQTYQLQQGLNARGKDHYWFGQKITGTLVTRLPEGFEIFEKPDSAQVYLRKIEPTVILAHEMEQVHAALAAHLGPGMALVDLEGKNRGQIVVYAADMDAETRLSQIHTAFGGWAAESNSLRDLVRRNRHFEKLLRFTLIDATKRLFSTERWCFRGSIDNWITLHFGSIYAPNRGDADMSLTGQLARYIPHLGKQSFFDLM